MKNTLYYLIIAFTLFEITGCKSTADITGAKQSVSISEEPVIFRRTTLIVHDIEESMLLYRDAMGMSVIYDNIIKRPHPEGEGEQHIRLVFLKATHEHVGVIGLVDYEYNNKDKIKKEKRREGFTTQNAVLLFNTNSLMDNFEKIKDVPGVEIVKEPGIRKYPSYDGSDVIEVLVSIFYDPDGFLVEYNQILSGM